MMKKSQNKEEEDEAEASENEEDPHAKQFLDESAPAE
jgi:hypothetical protein